MLRAVTWALIVAGLFGCSTSTSTPTESAPVPTVPSGRSKSDPAATPPSGGKPAPASAVPAR